MSAETTMRIPVALVWRRKGPLVHAWASTSKGAVGFCLCGRYKRLHRLAAASSSSSDVRCPECETRARLLSIAMPHADHLAALGVAALKRRGLELLRELGLPLPTPSS